MIIVIYNRPLIWNLFIMWTVASNFPWRIPNTPSKILPSKLRLLPVAYAAAQPHVLSVAASINSYTHEGFQWHGKFQRIHTSSWFRLTPPARGDFDMAKPHQPAMNMKWRAEMLLLMVVAAAQEQSACVTISLSFVREEWILASVPQSDRWQDNVISRRVSTSDAYTYQEWVSLWCDWLTDEWLRSYHSELGWDGCDLGVETSIKDTARVK